MRVPARLIAPIGALAIALVAAPALAATPYAGAGYDASSAQCGSPPPSGQAFAIVAATGGRPFSPDRCAASLWAAATGAIPRALYLNTGYSGAYGRDITPACRGLAAAAGYARAAAKAYAIGCSEAAYAAGYASAQGVGTPAGWWADVETANSWSSSDLHLNLDTLTGMAAWFTQNRAGVPFGLYATAAAWQTITGGSPLLAALPEWTVASVGASCPSTGFGGGPVLLQQSGTQTDSAGVAYDEDQGC